MKKHHRNIACAIIAGLGSNLLGGIPAYGDAAVFRDPLDTPAEETRRAATGLMLAVARAGGRLVAVGELGRIVISEDDGRNWRQVPVPVSTDLTAVHFPTTRQGWAVGHGGAVLHSVDGGLSWTRQLDGRDAASLLRAHYSRLRDSGDADAARFLAVVENDFANGPELPFLSVWFRNQDEGFVVGAFGLILATTDGGRHWQPWMERVENPDELHLTAIAGVGDDVFIVGEQGRVWKLDAAAHRFTQQRTPYEGTLFGIAGDRAGIVAFGLRGNAVRSADGGDRWQALPLPAQSYNINGSTLLDDGRLVLVTQGGGLLIGRTDGAPFTARPATVPSLLAGVAPAGADAVVVAGLSGVRREPLAQNGAQNGGRP